MQEVSVTDMWFGIRTELILSKLKKGHEKKFWQRHIQ